MQHIFRNPLFMASGLSHLTIDVFNSAGPVLVAFFSLPLGLDNKLVALILGGYQFCSAISQPLFGWVADRYGLRWLMGLSVAWTVGFITLATFFAQADYLFGFALFFIVAAFGSAAYHPVGTKNAALTINKHVATATALFFLFGQTGLAFGPLISGAILEWVGPKGIYLLALFAIPIVSFAVKTVLTVIPSKQTISQVNTPISSSSASTKQNQVAWTALGILILHTVCRSWAQIGTISFIPKLFQDKGWPPTTYGALTGTMWFASAIMGVVAGNMADRWGRRQVIFGTMMAAVIPLYFLPISNTAFAFVLALLVGGLTGSPHSITVVIAQDLLPNKQATASGLILGLIFGMGALAVVAIGWLADWWTLGKTLQFGAVMSFLAAITALALPKTQTKRV